MKMTQNLFIPDKIKVGFQNREGTYTKKLAYVIYFDQKGVLRKEKSWEIWRDHKIKPVEFNNEPTEGFVLNKGVGGQRQSYGWNARNEYIRVYDPRDFEFEISVANLLFILKETDCSRGKGLEGKFVYAWDGTELVLLPENSQDYQNSKNFTKLQSQSVKVKDLINGASYITRKQENLTYIGKFDYHCKKWLRNRPVGTNGYEHLIEKRFIFWNGEEFLPLKGIGSIASINSDSVVANYAEMVDNYYKSSHGSKIVKFFLKKQKTKCSENWFYEESDGVFIECSNWNDKVFNTLQKYSIKDDKIITESYPTVGYKNKEDEKYYNHHYNGYGRNKNEIVPYREPTDYRLFAELESGSKFKYDYENFYERK